MNTEEWGKLQLVLGYFETCSTNKRRYIPLEKK